MRAACSAAAAGARRLARLAWGAPPGAGWGGAWRRGGGGGSGARARALCAGALQQQVGQQHAACPEALFARAEAALHRDEDAQLAAALLRAAERASASGPTLALRSRLVTALEWAGEAGAAAEAAEEGRALGLWDDPLQRPGTRFDRRMPSSPFPLEQGVVREHGYSEVAAAVEAVELAAPALLPRMRAEFADLAHAAPQEAENLIAPGAGRWTHLALDGLDSADGWDIFPATTALVRNCLLGKGLELLRVRFSNIQPGTYIRPHCGPTNRRWILHLGVDVPPPEEGELYLEVAGVRRRWKNGRCLVFDDSFTHEVYHGCTSDRLILHCDFVHPAVRRLESEQ